MINNIETLVTTDPDLLLSFITTLMRDINDFLGSDADRNPDGTYWYGTEFDNLEELIEHIKDEVEAINTGEWYDMDVANIASEWVTREFSLSQYVAMPGLDGLSVHEFLVKHIGCTMDLITSEGGHEGGGEHCEASFSVHRTALNLGDLNVRETYDALLDHSLGSFVIYGYYASHNGTEWEDELHVAKISVIECLNITKAE